MFRLTKTKILNIRISGPWMPCRHDDLLSVITLFRIWLRNPLRITVYSAMHWWQVDSRTTDNVPMPWHNHGSRLFVRHNGLLMVLNQYGQHPLLSGTIPTHCGMFDRNKIVVIHKTIVYHWKNVNGEKNIKSQKAMSFDCAVWGQIASTNS